jgi:hypothetical protein
MRRSILFHSFLSYSRWVLLGSLLSFHTATAQSAPATIDPGEVIRRMEEQNTLRNQALRFYVSERLYEAENPRLNRRGYALVELRYDAPESKTYRVVERGGSGSIHSRVFDPLLKAEVANTNQAAREASEVSSRNYVFTYSHFDEEAQAYVFDVAPRTNNKFLFRGRVWIDANDFAAQRIEGEPAQRPSFWVRRTHFVRRYAKFGDFWFPVSLESDAEVRLIGHSKLGINYFHYQWEPAPVTTTTLNQVGVSPPLRSQVCCGVLQRGAVKP